jgi:CDP-diacylglycerol---glycerol-3-phosphate 3-phosphatidyltransferase
MPRVINARIRQGWDKLMSPAGRAFQRAGINANAVTLFGLLLQGVVAYFIVQGRLVLAGLIAIVAAFADAFDGAIAKAAGTASNWGAFIDSTADRISDALFFLPVAWLYGTSPYAPQLHQKWVASLALVAMVLGFLVSYIKARAEGLGYDCNVGIAERAERLILIIAALILNFILPLMLGILAALSLITVIQRLVHVRKQATEAAT